MVSHPQSPKKVSKTRWTHPAANPQIYKGIGEATDKPPSLGTKDKPAESTRRYSRVWGWDGGSAAIMSVADRDDKTSGKVRKLWLFDSFCGLPPPSNKDGKQARKTYFQGWCQGETEKVKRIFRRFQAFVTACQHYCRGVATPFQLKGQLGLLSHKVLMMSNLDNLSC